MSEKEYIVIVQCYIVKQRCSGYNCEKAFHHRDGGFERYPKDKVFRTLYMTCGGCCGRATHRKLDNLAKEIKTMEGVEKDKIVVHLSSCITKESYHGSPCPHLSYLKGLIGKLGLDVIQDTAISKKAEERRKKNVYRA